MYKLMIALHEPIPELVTRNPMEREIFDEGYLSVMRFGHRA